LLRGFQEDSLPAVRSFRCRCEQSLFTAFRGERDNRGSLQVRWPFDGPFEDVKLHDGQQKGDIHVDVDDGQLLEQGELDAIAADTFNAAEPNLFAIAQFIELAGLRAQHAAQVVRRFAFHNGSLTRKLLHEKSSSHARSILDMGLAACRAQERRKITQRRRDAEISQRRKIGGGAPRLRIEKNFTCKGVSYSD